MPRVQELMIEGPDGFEDHRLMDRSRQVAIVQSNYIPWKGYFDLIQRVDEFIFYDEVQYTRRDWRNRNRIRTPEGLHWLTIPVRVSGRYHQKISETMISDPGWSMRHWKTLQQSYAGAPHFNDYRECFQDLYLGCSEASLSRINFRFVREICSILDIRTRLSWSTEYPSAGNRTERLLQICQKAGAGTYVSGPKAKTYLDEAAFQAQGIQVEWMTYSGYPVYRQLYEDTQPFEHAVSVVDLIFCLGSEARAHLSRSVPSAPPPVAQGHPGSGGVQG